MIIAEATALLDPQEARAAEAMVLGRAGTLTPPGLRAAITRAVMDVAPGKAKKRREHAAEKTRVERWAEASGNAGLAGRELPPAQVLAADQRVTAWAKELGRPAWRAAWMRCGPVLTWTSCSAWTPGRSAAARTAAASPRTQTGPRVRPGPRIRPSPRTRLRLRGRGRAGRWPG